MAFDGPSTRRRTASTMREIDLVTAAAIDALQAALLAHAETRRAIRQLQSPAAREIAQIEHNEAVLRLAGARSGLDRVLLGEA